MPTTINRLNDFYVKYLLGSEKRKHLTIHFLNAVLYGDDAPQIADVFFLDKDLDPERADGKPAKLDILAKTDQGMLINVEVQVRRQAHLAERFLFYWAEMYGSQMKRGDGYNALKPSVSIILTEFDHLSEASWHNAYSICNDVSRRRLNDHFAMHFIELKKFTYSDVKALHRLGRWTAYFSNCGDRETEELAMSDPVMKEVVQAETAFTEDEIMRRKYSQREKAVRDYISAMDEARNEGLQEGIVQMAVKMLENGIDRHTVAAITGLSEQELAALKTAAAGGCDA